MTECGCRPSIYVGEEDHSCEIESDDCKCEELEESVADLTRRLDEALDALVQVVWQACGDDTDELDSRALSCYAQGMRTLADAGLIKIESEYGRRVIGKFLVDPMDTHKSRRMQIRGTP